MKQKALFAEVSSLPPGFSYRPDFLTLAEEASLLAGIGKLSFREAPYLQFTARRRIVSFGKGYDFTTRDLVEAAPFPTFLSPVLRRVAEWLEVPVEQLAHALVTEYRPGTPIGWHRDAPNFDSVVGISLAGSCQFRFRPYEAERRTRKDVVSTTLEPRSAYWMQGPARWQWQHSIPPTTVLRYSITLRTLRERVSPGGQPI